MKNRTKVIIALTLAAVLVIAGLLIYWETHHGNRRLVDTKYRFGYGIIQLPNGEVVEGKVTSWLDYSDSDVVQVTIKGKTYLTSYVNVCLVDD